MKGIRECARGLLGVGEGGSWAQGPGSEEDGRQEGVRSLGPIEHRNEEFEFFG